MKIKKPTAYKNHLFIRFLNTQNVPGTEMQREIFKVSSEESTNDSILQRWVCNLSKARTVCLMRRLTGSISPFLVKINPCCQREYFVSHLKASSDGYKFQVEATASESVKT